MPSSAVVSGCLDEGHAPTFSLIQLIIHNRLRWPGTRMRRLDFRQMIRTRLLETMQVTLPSGRTLRAPTAEETLRIKGFLIVRRNQTRDYLDVAASLRPWRAYGVG
jgi:hypothetical protein